MSNTSHGTKVQIDVSSTLTDIPGVGDIDFSPGEWGEIDFTSHSSNNEEEVVKGIRRGAALNFPINWDPTEATHNELQTAFDSRDKFKFRVIFPDAANKTFEFDGYVMRLTAAAPVEGKMSRDVSIKITGELTEDPT